MSVTAMPIVLRRELDGAPPDDTQGDPCVGLVAGDRLTTSVGALMRKIAANLRREQEKPLPDNALIDTLCEAARLCREHVSERSVIPVSALIPIGDGDYPIIADPDLEPDKSWVLAEPIYMPNPGTLHLRLEDPGAEADFSEWEVVLQSDGIVKAAPFAGGGSFSAHVFADNWRRFALDRPGLWIHRSGLPAGYEPPIPPDGRKPG